MKKSYNKRRCEKCLYVVITLAAIACALFFVDYGFFRAPQLSICQILIMFVLIALVHITKFVRFYFILLEEMMPLSTAIKTYAKTTLVSILIPFKIGEIYRMYAFGYKLNSYPKGVIAVVIDKFFDAIVLCMILAGGVLMYGSANYFLLVILLGFIILAVLIYCLFEPSYRYLNRFFIVRGGGIKSLRALKILDKSHKIYQNAKRMVYGRQLACLVLSVLAWGIEYATLMIANGPSDNPLVASSIPSYISDGFFGLSNGLLSSYIFCCAIVFVFAVAIAYIIELKHTWRMS